jgi:hypothetical protein
MKAPKVAASHKFRAVLIGALLSVVMGPIACTDAAQPAAPLTSAHPAPSSDGGYEAAPAFPAPSRHAQIYVEGEPVYAFMYPHYGCKVASRYVLYDDGSFALQFSSVHGFFEYVGIFGKADSAVELLFRDASRAGSWDAAGTIQGDSLRVKYNVIMVGSDFNNGLYVRAPDSH